MSTTSIRLVQSILAMLMLWVSQVSAEPPIHFELATERGFPITGTQDWMRLFARFPETRVRLRAARESERESVRNTGSDRLPSYSVTGLLTRRNRLHLPGASAFTLGDRDRLETWIRELREKGPPGERATQLAFGLQSDELVAFHGRMAKPIRFDTQGERAGDVARRIVAALDVKFTVSEKARRAFALNDKVADQLNTMSCGTALAAMLRPLGLAVAPTKKQGAINLHIAEADELEEWWPIGWPLQQAPYKAAPELFKRLPVTIKQQPLQKTLDAIQGRVAVPFAVDHNSLARQGIDPSQASVSFESKRVLYKRVLDNILFQCQLKGELRTDDAGRPFVWITTIKK